MDLYNLDKTMFFLINHGAAHPVLDQVMPFLSARGYFLIIPYAIYLFWMASGNRSRKSGLDASYVFGMSIIAIFSVLLTDWLGNELKHTIMRARPCQALENVRLLAGCTSSGSLPSNHAANSFAYAIPLFYLTRNHIGILKRLYPLALACLIALSRVYVGVHYPSDIVAGALFGTTISFSLIGMYRFSGRHYKSDPETTLLFAGLLVISVFRIYYILDGPLDLSPDEAHYWEWSRRLDLSYYSKGPMIAYLIFAGTSLFGSTVFGVRILAVAFSALSSIFLFKLVHLMYGNEAEARSAAVTSALAFQAVPLFAAFGILFTIDSPFIFFWILSLYIFYQAISEKPSKEGPAGNYDKEQWLHWIALGISIGLGLLTKYTMAFFPFCALLFMLFSDRRAILRTPMPYVSFIISVLIFTPVIIWNAEHNWVTLRHTAGQAHIADGIAFSMKSFLEFLGSQIGIITPLFFFLMIYSLFKLLFSERSLQSKFLFYFSVPVLGFFLLKSFQGKVQANWAMFGYVTGIIAAVWLSKNRSNAKRTFLAVGLGLALLVTAISHYPSMIHLPRKLDPSARLKGWKQLGREVDIVVNSRNGQGHFLLFSDSYQIASELAFYVPGNPETFSINLGRRMDQYDFWPDINYRSEQLSHPNGSSSAPVTPVNGIFVQSGNTEMPPVVANAFDHFEKNVFRVYDHGSIIREYSIFICYNFRNLKTGKPETY
jgi:membrane-associated phospholipid phosphatase